MAYCPDHKDYVSPTSSHAQRCVLFSGNEQVGVRPSVNGRLHFFRPNGGNGGAPESAAHVFAKVAVKRLGRFYAVIDGEPTFVRFLTCALEQRLASRTPDITVTVDFSWPPRLACGSELLIEIHATNSTARDPLRIPALRDLGIPCFEVSLPKKAVEWHPNDDDDYAALSRYVLAVMRKPNEVHWVVPEKVRRHCGSGTISFFRRPSEL